MNKRTATAAILATVLLALTGAAATMLHAQANESHQPRWEQAVITINDKAMVDAAQGWDAPMAVVYAAQGADIQVTRTLPGGKVAGEARRITDGNTITGCTVQVQTETETRAVLAHEVGHCLGLTGHAMTATSLMYPETGRPGVSALDVTDADRAALALIYASAS